MNLVRPDDVAAGDDVRQELPTFLALRPTEQFGPDVSRFYTPLIVAGVSLGLFDVCFAPLASWLGPTRALPFVFVGMAVIAAQVSLITIWGVLAPASLLSRALGTGGLLATFAWCWVSGFGFASSGMGVREMLQLYVIVFGSLPVLVLAIQFPLWIAKGWARWELAHLSRPKMFFRRQPVTIRGLFVATAVVGAALATAQAATGLLAALSFPDADEFMVGLLVSAGCVALGSLAVMLPLVSLLLGSRRWQYAGAGVLICFLATVSVSLLVVTVINGLPSNAQIGVTVASVAVYLLLTAAGLLATRWAGFCLRRAE